MASVDARQQISHSQHVASLLDDSSPGGGQERGGGRWREAEFGYRMYSLGVNVRYSNLGSFSLSLLVKVMLTTSCSFSVDLTRVGRHRCSNSCSVVPIGFSK